MKVQKIHARVKYHLDDGQVVVGDVTIDPSIPGNLPEYLAEQVRHKATAIERKIKEPLG